jgi:hypothetical protein
MTNKILMTLDTDIVNHILTCDSLDLGTIIKKILKEEVLREEVYSDKELEKMNNFSAFVYRTLVDKKNERKEKSEMFKKTWIARKSLRGVKGE